MSTTPGSWEGKANEDWAAGWAAGLAAGRAERDHTLTAIRALCDEWGSVKSDSVADDLIHWALADLLRVVLDGQAPTQATEAACDLGGEDDE